MKTYSLKIGTLGMFVFVIIVFIALPFACVKLDGLLRLPGSITPMDRLLGAILLLIGGAVALWCVILFLAIGKGTPVPIHPPKKFIVRGPYQYSRNPMMLGAWLMLIGEALILHSFLLLCFTVFISIPAGVLFVIKYEEHDLEERFGNEYSGYKKKVPRWIPRP
jgi:protein-S-isoprenylcysteine O-methyltransferase Ste14